MTDLELANPPGEVATLGADLVELEAVISRGLGSFMEVGNALMAIREGGKFREAGFDTFEAYCQGRWGFTRSRANQFIKATQRAVDVASVASIQPRSEGQIRPLTSLPPEIASAAWADAVEVAGGEQPTVMQVNEAVRRVRNPPSRKPDLGGGLSHPARFSPQLFPHFIELLQGCRDVLDPFAGTGLIHRLEESGFQTVGIEVEEEWAGMHPNTQVGDALNLPFGDEEFDAICTSPTYGNRLADHHDAVDPESRRSYRHDLGRPLSVANSGQLQWGPEYRAFHIAAWEEAVRVLRPNGRFVLNIKDHIRDGVWQDVAAFHVGALLERGLTLTNVRPVVTHGMGDGENREARVDAELVVGFTKGLW